MVMLGDNVEQCCGGHYHNRYDLIRRAYLHCHQLLERLKLQPLPGQPLPWSRFDRSGWFTLTIAYTGFNSIYGWIGA